MAEFINSGVAKLSSMANREKARSRALGVRPWAARKREARMSHEALTAAFVGILAGRAKAS